jgi:hypothetical protein
VTRRCVATFATTERHNLVAIVLDEAFVKDEERTLPQTALAILLCVAHDSTVDLVDLGESPCRHDCAEDLTAHSTGAVGHDRSLLQVVVDATVEDPYEVSRRLRVRDDGITKSPNCGLEGVATIEKDHVVTAVLHQFMHLARTEVDTSPDDAALVDLEFSGRAEGDDLVTYPYSQSWKVATRAIGPFHVEVGETGVAFGGRNIALESGHRPTQCRVDAVVRDEDPSHEAQ